jgi:hypothetical protein
VVTARHAVTFAVWFLLAAAPAALWLLVTGTWMPWWAALGVGAGMYAAVEVRRPGSRRPSARLLCRPCRRRL